MENNIDKQHKLIEVKDANLIKFEEKGQKLTGYFNGIEISESTKFKGTQNYLVSVKKEDGEIYSVFVNEPCYRKFQNAELRKGQYIELTYMGKVETKDKTKDYHTYDLQKEI